MQTLLIQEELDVTRKTRANTFNWRGQFTPQLVEHLLTNYARKEDVVVDPFQVVELFWLSAQGKACNVMGWKLTQQLMPCQSSMLLQTCIGRKEWNFSVPFSKNSFNSLPLIPAFQFGARVRIFVNNIKT